MERMKGALRHAWIAGLVGALVLWTPQISHACAVCFSGREDEARLAFIWTTVLLTFLPLVMIGGFAWWLWRRARGLEQKVAPETGAAPLPALNRASSSR
jgi:hypothetical protein